jgi:GWxTD domain-containing protein
MQGKDRAYSLLISLSILLTPAPAFVQKTDLPDNYRRWLEEEVVYIITSKEKAVFVELDTDRDRELFIAAFWKQRDPTRGTDANEFREEHYRRINYADRSFRGAGKPGWKTDRGKVYILLGEPMSRREFGGLDDYYPAELWYYQGLESTDLPEAFQLLFYKKGRIGDYVLYNPGVDGPWTLMPNYQGDQFDYLAAYNILRAIEPELALASLSLIPGESTSTYPSLASAVILNNIDMSARKKVEDIYAQKFVQYKDIIEVEYTANYIESNATVKIFRDEKGRDFIHFALEPVSISVGEYGGQIYTHLEFSGIVSDEKGRAIYQFQKGVPLRYKPEQYEKMRDRPIRFENCFPIVPGRYRFSVIMKNNVSKEFTSFERELTIPERSSVPQMSELLLAFNANMAKPSGAASQTFRFGSVQFYSQAGNIFVQRDKIAVFFQMFYLPDDLCSSGSLKFVFFKDDQVQESFLIPLSEFPKSTNFCRVFALDSFPPGYYKLVVSLVDREKSEIASRQEPFLISPQSHLARPYLHSDSMAGDSAAEINFILGGQLLAKEEYAAARDYLRAAYEEAPQKAEYAMSLARAEFELERFEETARLIDPLVDNPEATLDLLVLAGRSRLRMGQHDQAIRVLKAALERFGITAEILNLLGECYTQVEDWSGALSAYEKSLSLNDNQPEIRQRVKALRERRNR